MFSNLNPLKTTTVDLKGHEVQFAAACEQLETCHVSGRTVRGDNQHEVRMLTEQDYRISIENAISALCKAGKTADVAHVLKVFGHGANSVEDLAPSDYEAVFSELHDHERELDD